MEASSISTLVVMYVLDESLCSLDGLAVAWNLRGYRLVSS